MQKSIHIRKLKEDLNQYASTFIDQDVGPESKKMDLNLMLQAAAIQFMPLFDNILPVTPPLPPDKKAEPLAHYRAC